METDGRARAVPAGHVGSLNVSKRPVHFLCILLGAAGVAGADAAGADAFIYLFIYCETAHGASRQSRSSLRPVVASQYR